MPTTLTREQLLAKGKPTYEEVEVPGFGVVGIRQRSELKRMQRLRQLFKNKDSDEVDSQAADRRNVYAIIDQVMVDENTPMFTNADVETLSDMKEGTLDPLIVAINEFNERVDPEKKDTGESKDSSKS